MSITCTYLFLFLVSHILVQGVELCFRFAFVSAFACECEWAACNLMTS